MKSFTDLEQSKVLAEILPHESADMCYVWDYERKCYTPELFSFIPNQDNEGVEYIDYPCWSLAALIAILSEINGVSLKIEKLKAKDGYDGYYYPIQYEGIVLIPYSKNPVDACYEMILKLKESDLL